MTQTKLERKTKRVTDFESEFWELFPVCESAAASFCRRCRGAKFLESDFKSSIALKLWAVLRYCKPTKQYCRTLAVNCCIDAWHDEHLTLSRSKSRQLLRECKSSKDFESSLLHVVRLDSTPQTHAETCCNQDDSELAECIEKITADPLHREWLKLRCHGFTFGDIAEIYAVSPRQVRRFFALLRSRYDCQSFQILIN